MDDMTKSGSDELDEDTLLVDSLTEHRPCCPPQSIAYAAAFASVLMAGTCMAASQLLGGSVPSFQLTSWRFSFQTIVVSCYALVTKSDLKLSKESFLPVLGCIILQTFSSLARFTATISVSVGTVEGLIFSVAISINVALTVCKKEKSPGYLYVCGVMSFIGILFLSQPTFIFHVQHEGVLNG